MILSILKKLLTLIMKLLKNWRNKSLQKKMQIKKIKCRFHLCNFNKNYLNKWKIFLVEMLFKMSGKKDKI